MSHGGKLALIQTVVTLLIFGSIIALKAGPIWIALGVSSYLAVLLYISNAQATFYSGDTKEGIDVFLWACMDIMIDLFSWFLFGILLLLVSL